MGGNLLKMIMLQAYLRLGSRREPRLPVGTQTPNPKPQTPNLKLVAVTPASAVHGKSAAKAYLSSSDDEDDDSIPENDDEIPDDESMLQSRSPSYQAHHGMGTSSACAHLPCELNVQQHIHTIYKTELNVPYVCDVCGGHGPGGLVYSCSEVGCGSWCSHLRCVIPPPTRDDKGFDTGMLLRPAVVATMYTLPANQSLSDAFGLRAVLIMDGCNGQVRAAKDLLESIFYPKGIDIIKGSAQCSPSQNPLDCMRSFMLVKKSKPTWTWATATNVSTEMGQFISSDFRETMKNCSQTDVNSFVLSLMHLEQTVSSCFTAKIMQSGWAKAGLIGLELNIIMSHWIGWKLLSAEQVQGAFVYLFIASQCLTFTSGIRNLLPAFFHECNATGILSDASMQAMQPYFDVDFYHYAVDRAALSTSRTRAQLMSVFERKLRQATLDALCRDLALGSDEKEKRPEHPTLDAKGLCCCPCKSRHYKNDDASWEKHITYKKHRCVCGLFVLLPNYVLRRDWRNVQRGIAADAAVAARAFRPAHEHEWFNQPGMSLLREFAERMQLNFSVVKFFSKLPIKDQDLAWIACKWSIARVAF